VLKIFFSRTRPHHRYLEHCEGGTDAEYFSGNAMTAAPRAFEIDIRQIKLACESIKLSDPQRLLDYNRSSLRFEIDLPHATARHVPEGVSDVTLTFPVEKGVQMAYLGFVFQSNLNYNEASKHWCGFRSVWPSNLKKIRFFYAGEEMLFKDGLSRLEENGEMDGELYKEYLRDMDMLDYERPDIVRRGAKSYRLIFPVNLSSVDTDGHNELSCQLYFGGAGNSPKQLQMYCIRVQEGELVRDFSQGQAKWSVNASA
jgi:hypothetical protein